MFTVVHVYVGVLKSNLKASGSVTTDIVAVRERKALWQAVEQTKAERRRGLEALLLCFYYV